MPGVGGGIGSEPVSFSDKAYFFKEDTTFLVLLTVLLGFQVDPSQQGAAHGALNVGDLVNAGNQHAVFNGAAEHVDGFFEQKRTPQSSLKALRDDVLLIGEMCVTSGAGVHPWRV